jgi:hypothetical protein
MNKKKQVVQEIYFILSNSFEHELQYLLDDGQFTKTGDEELDRGVITNLNELYDWFYDCVSCNLHSFYFLTQEEKDSWKSTDKSQILKTIKKFVSEFGFIVPDMIEKFNLK